MLSFKRTLLSTLVSAVLSGTAFARADLPNFSAEFQTAPAKAAAASARAVALPGEDVTERQAALAEAAVSQNLIAGSGDVSFADGQGAPSFVWASPSLARPAVSHLKPELQSRAAAESYLRRYAGLYGLDSQTLSGATLSGLHDTGKGAVIASYSQRVAGIEVFGQELSVAMARDLRLVSLSGSLSAKANHLLKSTEALASASSQGREGFALAPAAAIVKAFADLGGTLTEGALSQSRRAGDYQFYQASPAGSGYQLIEPVRLKKIWFNLPDGLEPGYYLELTAADQGSRDSDSFAYVISARSGEVLFRMNQTVADSFSYRVFADSEGVQLPWDGPQGKYGQPNATGGALGPLPSGTELFKAQNLVTVIKGPRQASDKPWLPAGATETLGNNVDAYVDAKEPNGYGDGDFRAETTAPNTFDYLLDPQRQADADLTQRKAAVVQMFYLNNWLHDWFYDAGFDEKSGNAQRSNFGLGGVENDPVLAEAQDYSGTNNANMSTRSDGLSPRMQMYFFTYATVESSLGTFRSKGAGFGPQDYAPVSGELVRYQDAAGTDFGCLPASNAAALRGKIALIQRGNVAGGPSCGFILKVQNAAAAGASAVLVYNNIDEPATAGMGGDDKTVKIPSQGLTYKTGQAMIAAMANGPFNVKLSMSRDRDSSVDSLIVAHEWGHYISNRLVRNSAGLTNNQGKSMGEGWGDFHAFLMTVEPEDVNVLGNTGFNGVYAQGGYADLDLLKAGNAGTFYWGIRRVPYTTDMSKNGLTFKHIENGVPLPNHPVQFGADGASNASVHNAGEVWGTMLWECYVSLLNHYPFATAQDKMKRFLVAGYKLTPASPTFVEARNALMTAARGDSEADFELFAAAFAKRGMGAGAVAPERSDMTHSGVVESFRVGGALTTIKTAVNANYERSIDGKLTRLYCDKDGVLDAGETALLTVRIANTGFKNLSGASAQLSSSADVAFAGGGKLSFPALKPLEEAEATIEVTLKSAATAERVQFDIAYSSPDAPDSSSRFSVQTNYDLQAALTLDDGNKGSSDWTMKSLAVPNYGTPDVPTFTLKNTLLPKQDPQNFIYHGADNGQKTDVVMESPALVVGSDDRLVVSWEQAWSFDSQLTSNYDGGVVEYSVDNGATWLDAGAALTPAYNGKLAAGSPLASRQAFVAKSAGFPALAKQTLDLSGKGLAEKTVKIRFRIGSDVNVGAPGWFIDNIDVKGVSNKPFTAPVEDKKQCLGTALKAVAGADQSVNGVDVVTLDGSASTKAEPDETLSFEWTQTAGKPVSVIGSSTAAQLRFVAGNEAETLTFRLTVSNGKGASHSDEVQITVKARSLPVVVLAPVGEVRGFSNVILDASASRDADGGELSYEFEQLAGPAVTLQGSGALRHFTAPNSTETLRFKVTASKPTSGGHLSASQNIDVAVKAHSLPSAVLSAPASVRGQDRVVLDASASGDADGAELRYDITPVGNSAVVLICEGPRCSFVADNTNQTLTFKLTVSKTIAGTTLSQDAFATVNVAARGLPQVVVEEARTVNGGASVRLDGSKSTHPDGARLTGFRWRQSKGAAVTLSNADTAQASFKAPAEKGELAFTLTVTDEFGLQSSAQSLVYVNGTSLGRAPVAAAGADLSVAGFETVTLDAGASTAGQGGELRYEWSQVEGTPVSLRTEGAKATFTSANRDEILRFKVVVSEGDFSSVDEVLVAVKAHHAPLIVAADSAVQGQDRVALAACGETAERCAGYSYQWTQLAGSPVAFDPNAAVLSFRAANRSETLRFEIQMSATVNGQIVRASKELAIRVSARALPVAKAGVDQRVKAGTAVVLEDRGSQAADGGALSYVWRQVSGPVIKLTAVGDRNAFFTAPDESGIVALLLTVTDSHGLSQSDEVLIDVSGAGVAPRAHAGSDVEVKGYTQVLLDGALSSAANGEPLQYLWLQSAGESVSLTSQGSRLLFEAPNVDDELRFKLIVVDSHGLTAVDEVIVTTRANAQPVAVAGDDQSVAGGEKTVLSAKGSHQPDGFGLRYRWSQLGGTAVVLAGEQTENVSFFAPEHQDTLRFGLTVTDALGQVAKDEIRVTVRAANTTTPMPVAKAGDDRAVRGQDEVLLDGAASLSPDKTPLQYVWQQVGGPEQSLTAEGSQLTFKAPNDNVTLDFTLTVVDGAGRKHVDAVAIKVEARRAAKLSAGDDDVVEVGQPVSLQGEVAGAEPASLRYRWTQTAGQAVPLLNSEQRRVDFEAPSKPGAYLFKLVATDSRGLTSDDEVLVTVKPKAKSGSSTPAPTPAPAPSSGGGGGLGWLGLALVPLVLRRRLRRA